MKRECSRQVSLRLSENSHTSPQGFACLYLMSFRDLANTGSSQKPNMMIGSLLLGVTVVAAAQLKAVPGEIGATGPDAHGPAATLKSLIASISGAMPSSSAPAAPANAAVAAIQKDLTDAAIMFDAAMNPYATAEEKSIKAAMRSAAAGPMTLTKSATSTGASFLRAIEGKISAGQLASIAAAAEATAEKHVASGRAQASCGSCTPNFSVCPKGFDSAAAGTCVPSASYSGFCNKSFAVSDYSAVELEEAEVFCNFCFPCK